MCTAANLRPVIFQSEERRRTSSWRCRPPSPRSRHDHRSGTEREGPDGLRQRPPRWPSSPSARAAPAGATIALGDEEALRPPSAAKGALSNRTAQTLHDLGWLRRRCRPSTTRPARRRTSSAARTQLVDALVPGSTGRLSAPARGRHRRLPPPGAVRAPLQPERGGAHRARRLAVTGQPRRPGRPSRRRTSSDGSALAQFGEPTAVQCERFSSRRAKVDFLFVVDDSGSMQTLAAVAGRRAPGRGGRAQRLVAGLAHGDGDLQPTTSAPATPNLRRLRELHPQREQVEGLAHREQHLHAPACCSVRAHHARDRHLPRRRHRGCQRRLLGGHRRQRQRGRARRGPQGHRRPHAGHRAAGRRVRTLARKDATPRGGACSGTRTTRPPATPRRRPTAAPGAARTRRAASA